MGYQPPPRMAGSSGCSAAKRATRSRHSSTERQSARRTSKSSPVANDGCRCASAKPGRTRRPPRSTVRVRGPAHSAASAALPSATIRPSLTASASWRERRASTVYTTPPVRTRSACIPALLSSAARSSVCHVLSQHRFVGAAPARGPLDETSHARLSRVDAVTNWPLYLVHPSGPLSLWSPHSFLGLPRIAKECVCRVHHPSPPVLRLSSAAASRASNARSTLPKGGTRSTSSRRPLARPWVATWPSSTRPSPPTTARCAPWRPSWSRPAGT